VVLDDEMTGGDFVRNARQLIDLLRQLSEVLPGEPERHAAVQAVDAMHRGVVDPVGEPQ
jgi:superfamily II RNA helicase